MKSVYQSVLGSRYSKLQPQLQEYFSLAAGSGTYGVGTGVFDVVGCPLPWLRPALAPAAAENTFFPEFGRGIPFRIENRAHLDPLGRPALTAVRQIEFPGRTRLFQDSTVLDPAHGLLDHVGKHRRLMTSLRLEITPAGHLRIASYRTHVPAGPVRFTVPGLIDAKAFTEQWWDAGAGRFRIQTKVIQPQLGAVFVYAGSFEYELLA